MTKKFQNLSDFVNLAKRNRKYADETATGYMVALNKFEEILNEDEKNSLDLINDRLDQIFSELVKKFSTTMSMSSLNVYKRRLIKIINDYDQYGNNPTAFNNWQPAVKNKVQRRSKKQTKSVSNKNSITAPEANGAEALIPHMEGYDTNKISLKSGLKAIFVTPANITKKDIEKIEAYLNYLKAIAKEA